ncbi:MAG: mechanosensitive ion channel family protein, partial [Eggerthellaceae bacterium]|nr:mechanosensitive ion channel family protein [Eggerthellaceae bacterium]
TIGDVLIQGAVKVIIALLVWFIGSFIIKKLVKLMEGMKGFKKQDETLRKFLHDAVKILLYVVLVVSIIGILGIPIASIVTILGAAGLAVGMALQGSLSNFAGGVMLMIFRPFKVGDYINAAGGEGTVKEISLFYTVLNTIDNKTITIPNGSLMNANVTNMTAEDLRRVDLTFGCAKGEDIAKVQQTMLDVMAANELVLKDPAPFARLSGGSNEAMEFTTRAWVKSADYWTVYFDLTQAITEALGAAGVKAPAVRVVTDK